MAALVAAAGIVTSVSFRLIDTDVWQHLAVGRAIWSLGHVPTQHLWTWPNFGMPDVLPSWLFRALLWPFWKAGEVPGLFVYRWLVTVLAFGALWAAARRMGARGLTPLVVLVLASLVYRQRSQIRPESLASILLALQLWVLETRRSGGPDRTLWLVPIAWAWASHISYFVGWIVLAVHLADAHVRARRDPGARGGIAPGSLGRLWLVAGLVVAVSFATPFGARGLAQPLDYLLRLRHEEMFRGIGELQPLGWLENQKNGAFVLLAGWPLLLLWRARRFGFDLAETLTCAFVTAYAISTQRFLGTYAIAAAPYAARDLDAWVGTRRWPAWTRPAASRAALAALACVGVGWAEWTRADRPLGVAMDMSRFPVAAVDFVARHGVRGRAFSPTRLSGYLLWRFWPDRSRLPFMDIHQTGTVEDRRLYTRVFSSRAGWAEMERAHTFDWVVLDRRPYPGDSLAEVLDAHPDWALVFVDDDGELYVRRSGPMAAVADSFGYRRIGAGREKMQRLASAWGADPALRAEAKDELKRQAASSPHEGTAHAALASLAIAEGRTGDARGHLQAALAADPRTPRLHEGLGLMALLENDPGRATAEFEREREISGPGAGIELRLGLARQLAGDLEGARGHLQRALALDPDNAEARELLRALEAGR